ncbi:TonB-dependent receptor domain-containing protein [Salegentibacter sp.]|uniref:TonB-dependent receptor n=1 Tax=Salegentibacter sp. TaxID=1903072 RepID=UPI0035616844
MKNIFLSFAVCCIVLSVNAQNSLEAEIYNNENNTPLLGANAIVKGTDIGTTADIDGKILLENIPDGNQIIEFSFLGFETEEIELQFPRTSAEVLQIYLEPSGEEMEEVIIRSTRSRRTIADLPTRVEVISGEELAEKGNMKPGDIRMLLNETTGIQTQQTSATSYNSSIRIQGLDGKYTQLLKDGYPLYSGFSGGLSLLQIVPLDLQQVEVIKGSSSTLYGGGAIAGLVNLISKTPGEERELNFMLNGTSALGLDLSGFYSEDYGKLGTTVFASYNMGSPYDPADIGLTAIPEFNRFTLNPRVFYEFTGNTKMDVGVNATMEERTGGNIDWLNGEPVTDPYFERNKTKRYTLQAGLEHNWDDNKRLNFKHSLSLFDRSLETGDFKFAGNQLTSYNEISINMGQMNSEWIAGVNLWVDRFDQDQLYDLPVVDYEHYTYGLFLQNNWTASDFFQLESGLRTDYQNEYGWFVLPRISAMFNISDAITSRIGGGLGYKAPSVFTEDAERLQFRNVLPIDVSTIEAENSLGGNFDINYRTELFDLIDFTSNTLFFYTKIDNPIILQPSGGMFEYVQPKGYVESKGLEANLKLGYRDFKLFTGYTFADVTRTENGVETLMPLVSKHRLNNVLMYELEESLKIGLEGYYFSEQQLSDGSTGQSYWIFGLMMEKLWDDFSIFLNFENFTDTRQTRFDSIFTGSVNNPEFRDIYAPVDGFVVNGGFKLFL